MLIDAIVWQWLNLNVVSLKEHDVLKPHCKMQLKSTGFKTKLAIPQKWKHKWMSELMIPVKNYD